MLTRNEIVDWAKRINLPPCVGAEFAQDHHSRLPTTLKVLDAWVDATYRRSLDFEGGWRCLGTAPALTT
ncbi:MAG: hypothetical protein ACYC4L_17980 [Chloroflexota bacterium]